MSWDMDGEPLFCISLSHGPYKPIKSDNIQQQQKENNWNLP